MKKHTQLTKEQREDRRLTKVRELFPDYPNPFTYDYEGKKFKKTGDSCKVCNHKYRELIERLIEDDTYSDADVVRWANHHNLFSKENYTLPPTRGRQASPTLYHQNVTDHKKKHMEEEKVLSVTGKHELEALKKAQSWPLTQKLEWMINQGIKDMITKNKTLSPPETRKAIETLFKVPGQMASAQMYQELAKRMGKRNAEKSTIN